MELEFVKKNNNPKSHKAADCVIRAITEAEGTDWKETFKGLAEIAYKNCRILNEKKVYEKYLENLGYTKYKMPKKPNGKKYTIKEYFKDNKKTVIITVPKHMTCLVGNELRDLWNCKNRTISNYWIKEVK